ncbi:fimbrial protein [Paraburkholderia aspalathi]|uniref:fimbrial protein n=1 Tax=Paraburkholderia aspalathi TaxID=1324617 RepID=UPI0038B80064
MNLIFRTFRRLGLALLALLVMGGVAHADCVYNGGNPYGGQPYALTSQLSINALTVGRDVPVGTVLYGQTIYPQTMRVDCVVPGGTISKIWALPSTPLPLSSWNQAPYAGHVYETGVPGIGIAVWSNGTPMPANITLNNCASGNDTCHWNVGTAAFDISLIKIGPVSPGVISGASLPTVRLTWDGGGTPLVLGNISFVGSIQIVAQTCTTPDVTVDLGTHTVQSLSSSTSSTPWKDFAIQLQACPAFYGASGRSYNTDSGSGFVPTGSTTANQIGFSLAPATSVIDPTNAIIALSAGTPSKPAASGIGIQIANGSGTPVSFNTVMPSGIVPQPTNLGSYSIPLQARYTTTGGPVTAGPADSSMTFTVNYQ